MAAALKKKKNQIKASKASSKKNGRKNRKKIKGKCKLMEASITRRQEPREAVTVTAHTYRWENSLLESGRGDG